MIIQIEFDHVKHQNRCFCMIRLFKSRTCSISSNLYDGIKPIKISHVQKFQRKK